jgi:hypothetical protein
MTNCSSFLSVGMSSIKTLLMHGWETHSTCPIYQNCARFQWQSGSNGISSLDGFTCTWMLQVPPGSTYLKKHTHTQDCGLGETGNLHVQRDVIREDGESSNTNVKAPSNRHQPAIVCVHRWSERVLLLSICSLLFSQMQHFEKFNYFSPQWKSVCKLSACLKPCAWREYVAESSMLSFLATFS